MPEKKKVKLSFVEDFILAGTAAAVSKTAAAPIERVKLLVQNQDEMIKQGRLSHPYKGVGDCVARVMAEEGIVPFWRGNMANVLRYFPTQALNFAIKPVVKGFFKQKKEDGALLKLGQNIASGGVAGSISLLFVYSLDFARTRLANDNKSAKKGGSGERQFNGLFDVYKKTLASDGIGGLYRGFVISCVGIFIYRGCYFGFYDSFKPLLGENPSGFSTFALGYGVTVVSGILSYPIDTIRRRMMMTSGSGVKYNGSLDAASQIMKAEGFMSFFKGAGANILRGVAGAGVLAGFDKFKQAYISYAYPDSA